MHPRVWWSNPGDARSTPRSALVTDSARRNQLPGVRGRSRTCSTTRCYRGIGRTAALNNTSKPAGQGVLKMSKMGISTLASAPVLQLFQAVGISSKVLDEYFTGLAPAPPADHLDDIAADVAAGTGWPIWTGRTNALTANSRWVGNTSGAAGSTCSARRLCSSAAALHANRPVQDLQGYPSVERPRQADGITAWSAQVPYRGSSSSPAGRGRAGQQSSILLSRGDELRLDSRWLDAGHRNVPGGAWSNCGEGDEDVKRFDRDPNGDWRQAPMASLRGFGVTSRA